MQKSKGIFGGRNEEGGAKERFYYGFQAGALWGKKARVGQVVFTGHERHRQNQVDRARPPWLSGKGGSGEGERESDGRVWGESALKRTGNRKFVQKKTEA